MQTFSRNGADASPLAPKPLSKNQQKKLKRDQEWEAGREKRKEIRREKTKERKRRKHAAQEQNGCQQAAWPIPEREKEKTPQGVKSQRVPVTFIIDCGFEGLMLDKEHKSLGSQVTRSYSDNHKAPFQSHLVISSFSGKLKERFEGLLNNHHQSWKGVHFSGEDFIVAAQQAKKWMKDQTSGNLAGAFEKMLIDSPAEVIQENGEIVYLTSDSPDTLTELRPYSTYIIGGLVDRNRHKGICYKKAMDQGVRTAKLPIGEYMQMNSRHVLATNHVVEIMLRWLETGDWGKAFDVVMPKRKGGVLRTRDDEAQGIANTEPEKAEDGLALEEKSPDSVSFSQPCL